jgi:hypothetical protein
VVGDTMRTDFFVFGGGAALSSSTVNQLLLHCQEAKETRQGNTIVAVSPTRFRHTAIRVDEGSLRDWRGSGLIESLGRAKRVSGSHGEVINNALFYLHGKSR